LGQSEFVRIGEGRDGLIQLIQQTLYHGCG
jgi:hypothetical protein